MGHSRTKNAIVCPFDIIKPAKVCFYSLIWFLVLTDDGRKKRAPDYHCASSKVRFMSSSSSSCSIVHFHFNLVTLVLAPIQIGSLGGVK